MCTTFGPQHLDDALIRLLGAHVREGERDRRVWRRLQRRQRTQRARYNVIRLEDQEELCIDLPGEFRPLEELMERVKPIEDRKVGVLLELGRAQLTDEERRDLALQPVWLAWPSKPLARTASPARRPGPSQPGLARLCYRVWSGPFVDLSATTLVLFCAANDNHESRKPKFCLQSGPVQSGC